VLEHLIEGEALRITASKAGYERARLADVEPGSTDLRIVLKRLPGHSLPD
jgi:hypothetical protein